MRCKFYSEEIGKCLFDGPSDDCPFDNKDEECACFRESKDIMKCKYCSDYESGHHDSGVCHYEETVGGFPMICTHKDDEDNCTCFEPVKGVGLFFYNCERVVFIGKNLGNIAEIDPDKIAKLDSIEINGRKFEVVE